MIYALAITLLLLAVIGVVARKTYFYLPLRELKRQAEKRDPLATQLYRAAAYGNSLKALLWLYIGLTTAAGIIVLARELDVWVSILVIGPILWIAFWLIPATRLTSVGARVTMFITPAIAWLLNYLHPALNRSANLVEKRTVGQHTGIFEREDLIRLIEQQQSQEDSRINEEELEIAKRALSFDDYEVGDLLTSHKKIKIVLADDTIGPILIDEMHKSRQEFVLVRESKKGPVVGTLEFEQINLETTGKVKDIMNPTAYFVHEDDSLSEALHAFFVTNHPQFVVVNKFEEYVGVITVQDMLRQLLGHVPGDGFEEYSNLEAVAAKHTKPKQSEEEPEDPIQTDEEVVE
ncbi:MAG TPA: CBS domain-containing protein [Methylomirabilota bacterium]|nr:CBS domain-containing protein [Methylomirabilota bacterium]